MKDKVKLHKEVLAKIDKQIDWYLDRKNAINGVIIIAVIIIGSLLYDDKIMPKSDIETDNELAVTDTAQSDTSSTEQSTTEGMEITSVDTASSEASSADTIKVFVDGEVINSGVYTLNKDDRIIDLIEMSGGFTKNAYSTGLNMAAFLADGEKVTIYSKSNKPSKSPYDKYDTAVARTEEGSSTTSVSSGKQVNINTATKEELKTLTGVGDVTASAIIEYREKNGDFKSTKAIKNVSGIGEKTFEKFSNDITVK